MSSKVLGGASMLANKNITFFGYNFSTKKKLLFWAQFCRKIKTRILLGDVELFLTIGVLFMIWWKIWSFLLNFLAYKKIVQLKALRLF